MIYLKNRETESYYVLPDPVYILRQRNGVLVRTEDPMRAQGVLDPTGEQILQFEDREPLEEGLELVTVVPSAEYEEWLGRQELPPTDPEDTEPNVPEGVEETDILTRAELTERVRMLEEELAKAMALLYPEGKEEDREP